MHFRIIITNNPKGKLMLLDDTLQVYMFCLNPIKENPRLVSLSTEGTENTEVQNGTKCSSKFVILNSVTAATLLRYLVVVLCLKISFGSNMVQLMLTRDNHGVCG